jgi:hypothetical protein
MQDNDGISISNSQPRFPLAREIPFAKFNNRYAGGSCFVVGRGPTDFDYALLADVSEPIIFINDAVCLAKHCRSETFFFAHDAQMLVWLNGTVNATAVVTIDGKVFHQTPGIELKHGGQIVYYEWRDKDREALLSMDRDRLAEIKQLYTHTGTIHSLLHFVWFCGFKRVSFIGCDCIDSNMPNDLHGSDGYDRRLENRSRSSSANYTAIGKVQNLLIALFGFDARYLGTPAHR